MTSTRKGQRTLFIIGLLSLAIGFGLGQLFLPPGSGDQDVSWPGDERSPAAPLALEQPVGTGALQPGVALEDDSKVPSTPAADAPTRRILGRVLDPWGDPVAGVTIIADPIEDKAARPANGTWIGTTPPPQGSLEERLQQTAGAWASRRAGRHQATSNEAGDFILTGLEHERYTVLGHRANWIIRTRNVEVDDSGLYAVSTGDVVIMEATPVRELELDIRMPDGSVAKTATLVYGGIFLKDPIEWSPQTPSIRVSKPKVAFHIYAGVPHERKRMGTTISSLHAGPIEVDLREVNSEPFVVALEAVSGIVGTIDWEETDPLDTNPWVVLEKIANRSSFDPSMVLDVFSGEPAWSGEFNYLNLVPGTYVVGIRDSTSQQQYVEGQYEFVEIKDSLVPVTIHVPAPPAVANLVVTCTQSDGEAVQIIQARYHRTSPTGFGQSEATFIRGPDSTYVFDGNHNFGFDLADWPEGQTLALTLESKDHGTAVVSVPRNQTQVETFFTTPASLDIEVTGFAEHIYADDMRIMLTETTNRGVTGSRNLSFFPKAGLDLSTDGRITIAAMPQGTWGVILQVERHELTSEVVSMGDSDQQVRLHAPRLYDIVISAPKVRKGWPMELRTNPEGGSEGTMEERLNGENKCRFSGVPAGTYYLKALGIREDPVAVVVPGTEFVYEGVLE